MSKRKVVEPALASWSEVDQALIRLCRLDVARRRLEADMNLELDRIKGIAMPKLADMAREDKAVRAQVQQFCEGHPDDFTPVKSVARLHGVLSFRTSPPAVKLKKKLATVVAAVHVVVKKAETFAIELKYEETPETKDENH